jgi:hypothetical protein
LLLDIRWIEGIRNDEDAAGPEAGPAASRLQSLAHAHCGPHWHCGPQAHTFCSAGCWQPQVQPAPGQLVQLHWDWVVGFMAMLLSVEMSRQCRIASRPQIEQNG